MKTTYPLPNEFEFSHWYCFFLHDQLVETLKSAEEVNVFNSTIKFNKKEHYKAIKAIVPAGRWILNQSIITACYYLTTLLIYQDIEQYWQFSLKK
ncbi:MAG: hypothetical protein PF503_14925, partial [Desulfobacula sp.]|nr:hypothetical protein [Desulfobacula sp.]